MSELIKREDAIKITWQEPQYYDPINVLTEVREKIRALPTVDAVQVVRCKDCKHRILNDHYGKKGYFNLKAMCDLDTGDIFGLGRNAENDDWFCADGERRSE